MTGELITLERETKTGTLATLRENGWEANEGYVSLSERAGFELPHLGFRYAADPGGFKIERYGDPFYRLPGTPIVAGRLTPAHQREGHLMAPVQDKTLLEVTTAHLAASDIGIDVAAFPMVDLLVAHPMPIGDAPLFLQGRIKYYCASGMALIFDGAQLNVNWVNNQGNVENTLPIAPRVMQNGTSTVGAFQITGALNSPTLTQVDNAAIRVVFLQKPQQNLRIIQELRPNVYNDYRPNDYTFGGGGLSRVLEFASRGENASTGDRTAPATPIMPQTGLILNIFPMVLPSTNALPAMKQMLDAFAQQS